MENVESQISWRRVLAVFLIIVLLLVLYALLRPKRRPELSVSCESPDGSQTHIAPEGSPTTKFLVQNQVIVIGPASAVETVINELRGQGIDLNEVRDCDLSYLGQLSDTRDLDIAYFPFPAETLNELTMRLYQIDDERSVGEVVETINQVGSDRYVLADPNYLTGLLAQSACSNPYEDGGSPFSGGPKPITTRAEADMLFREQWAFEHIGVDLSLKNAFEKSPIMTTGAGVRVGVFDTSPFREPLGSEPSERIETIGWVKPALELSVSFPDMVITLEATQPEAAADVRDHGLFVAGLIHAVAPESNIQLIRVLNEYGCGHLYTLNEALHHFIAEMETDRNALEGVVINLSLGVHKPGAVDVGAEDALKILREDPIESLRATVFLAHSRGAVVVAASGNDSDFGEEVLPMQLPAEYPFVIGVAASNIYRERACFSNWGDVFAPGGDGGPDEVQGLSCVSKVNECSGECDEAVISLVQHVDEGYGYWTGTSFSAPLVSGLAALVLDAGTSGSIWVSPRQVFEAIRCGALTPDGVINMPASLFRCLP